MAPAASPAAPRVARMLGVHTAEILARMRASSPAAAAPAPPPVAPASAVHAQTHKQQYTDSVPCLPAVMPAHLVLS
jgi:hypothetical protein